MSRFKNGDTTMTRAAVLFLLIILVAMLLIFFPSPKRTALFSDLPDSKRK